MTVNAYTVSKAFVFYNDCKSIVKMYYLNDVPFTFDELPDGHLWDKDLVEEATRNMPLDVDCLLYTSPSPRDKRQSRMPSSA